MVAIVSGNSLGLSLTSHGVPGTGGTPEPVGGGAGAARTSVNIFNGNLVVQAIDDELSAAGLDVMALRTYNSQGLRDDDNGDNWSSGILRRNLAFTGTLNTAGSTVIRTAQDGAQAIYAWNAQDGVYRSTAGSGAHDVIRYDGISSLVWTDGDTQQTETYRTSDGKLVASSDASGNDITDTEATEVNMRVKRSVAEFERNMGGMQGNLALYRRGANEFYLSQSFPWIYEQLEAVRSELEVLGMYERCRDALTQAEALIKKGPEHDEEAEALMLDATRALMQASGSREAMRRRYGASNDAQS